MIEDLTQQQPLNDLSGLREALTGLVAKCDALRGSLTELLAACEIEPTRGAKFSQDDLYGIARTVFDARSERDEHFKPNRIFSDPAWDLILELYILRHEDKRMPVSCAGVAANTPATTALRWVTVLEHAGLVMRIPDTLDSRRHFIDLTPHGIELTELALAVFGR